MRRRPTRLYGSVSSLDTSGEGWLAIVMADRLSLYRPFRYQWDKYAILVR